MESNVVVGNVTSEPKLYLTKRTGTAMANFGVAVNRRRKVGDVYVDRPAVFHNIICFGRLAEHVGYTVHTGMEVMAVGEWINDTYDDDRGRTRKRVTMEARVVGLSLRWVTASINTVERNAPVIPLPNPKTEPADDHKTGDHKSGEFPANTKPAEPAEPVAEAPRTTRKGERHAARAG